MAETDAPKQAQLRKRFEVEYEKSLAKLERLRAAFAGLERHKHPGLAWAREELRRVETAHEVLTNTLRTGGVDLDELKAS